MNTREDSYSVLINEEERSPFRPQRPCVFARVLCIFGVIAAATAGTVIAYKYLGHHSDPTVDHPGEPSLIPLANCTELSWGDVLTISEANFEFKQGDTLEQDCYPLRTPLEKENAHSPYWSVTTQLATQAQDLYFSFGKILGKNMEIAKRRFLNFMNATQTGFTGEGELVTLKGETVTVCSYSQAHQFNPLDPEFITTPCEELNLVARRKALKNTGFFGGSVSEEAREISKVLRNRN